MQTLSRFPAFHHCLDTACVFNIVRCHYPNSQVWKKLQSERQTRILIAPCTSGHAENLSTDRTVHCVMVHYSTDYVPRRCRYKHPWPRTQADATYLGSNKRSPVSSSKRIQAKLHISALVSYQTPVITCRMRMSRTAIS